MKTKVQALICFFVLFSIFGCKKQYLENENISEKISTVQNTKSGLGNPIGVVNTQKILIDGKEFYIPQKVLFNETKYFSESRISITPVEIVSVAGNAQSNKYLVTFSDDKGNVKEKNYFVVLSEKKVEVTDDLFKFKNIPVDFRGAIIKFDINDNILISKHFEKGTIVNVVDKIATKVSKKQLPIGGYAPLDEGCSYVTIDWFWETYENGILISSEYVFSSQIVVCEGGGGGGGSTPPTPEELCQQAINNILNDAQSTSNLLTNNVESVASLDQTKIYTWKCGKGAGWYVVATDRGVQNKQRVSDHWKWVSLTNLSVTQNGNTLSYGGSVTVTKNYDEPTLGLYFAKMAIQLHVRATVSYLGITLSDDRDLPPSVMTYNEGGPMPPVEE